MEAVHRFGELSQQAVLRARREVGIFPGVVKLLAGGHFFHQILEPILLKIGDDARQAGLCVRGQQSAFPGDARPSLPRGDDLGGGRRADEGIVETGHDLFAEILALDGQGQRHGIGRGWSSSCFRMTTGTGVVPPSP